MPRMKHLSKKSKSSPYKKVSTLDSFGFTSANEKTSGASSEGIYITFSHLFIANQVLNIVYSIWLYYY